MKESVHNNPDETKSVLGKKAEVVEVCSVCLAVKNPKTGQWEYNNSLKKGKIIRHTNCLRCFKNED